MHLHRPLLLSLAAICACALPSPSAAQSLADDSARLASVKEALRNLVTAQSLARASDGAYASSVDALIATTGALPAGVRARVAHADSASFTLLARHDGLGEAACVFFSGPLPEPPTTPRQRRPVPEKTIVCDDIDPAERYRMLLRGALRRAATLQDRHYGTAKAYTTDLAALGLEPPQGVIIEMVEASDRGWAARAAHPALEGGCIMTYGTVAAEMSTPGGLSPKPGRVVCDVGPGR